MGPKRNAITYNCGDVLNLTKKQAVNQFDGMVKFVPWVREFAGGFSCTSLSKQNSKRSQTTKFIEDETGATGETYAPIRDYTFKSRPALVILENVQELLSAPKDKDTEEASGSKKDVSQSHDQVKLWHAAEGPINPLETLFFHTVHVLAGVGGKSWL